MKYVMLLYAKESDVPSTPEQIKAARPAWDALGKEMEVAKVEGRVMGSRRSPTRPRCASAMARR